MICLRESAVDRRLIAEPTRYDGIRAGVRPDQRRIYPRPLQADYRSQFFNLEGDRFRCIMRRLLGCGHDSRYRLTDMANKLPSEWPPGRHLHRRAIRRPIVSQNRNGVQTSPRQVFSRSRCNDAVRSTGCFYIDCWGQSIVIGVAGAGQEISTRPVQLVTGRTWKGTAFGGARGRTDVPRIVDWYMDGKIEIDPMITHTLKLEDINKGFDLMHAGESIRSVVIY